MTLTVEFYHEIHFVKYRELFSQAWVDFINILRAAFTCPDLNSTNNTVKQSVFFALLGSARVKAVHKMLVKSTPAMSLLI